MAKHPLPVLGRFGVCLCVALATACGNDDSGGGDAKGKGGAGGSGSGGTSGSGGGSMTGHCTGLPLATWTVDGVDYDSDLALVSHVDDNWMINVIACASGDEDIQFTQLPPPTALATTALDVYIISMQTPTSGHAGVQYVDADGTGYYTDGMHTGTFEVTDYNAVGEQFSASFSFEALEHDGTKTVHITNGFLMNLNLPAN